MVEHATPAAPPTTDDVVAAGDRIRPFVWRTRLVELEIGGRRTLAKLEHMQLSGSFKVRGALNAALRARDTGARTVVAASGGNHGLGIAAAAELGLEAHVFLGDDAPRERIDRVSRPGVELHLVDGSYDQAVADALAASDERARCWHAWLFCRASLATRLSPGFGSRTTLGHSRRSSRSNGWTGSPTSSRAELSECVRLAVSRSPGPAFMSVPRRNRAARLLWGA